jgi:hypothetical protein
VFLTGRGLRRCGGAVPLPQSGRNSQLTRDDGLPIWVNLTNVLYVESIKLKD